MALVSLATPELVEELVAPGYTVECNYEEPSVILQFLPSYFPTLSALLIIGIILLIFDFITQYLILLISPHTLGPWCH